MAEQTNAPNTRMTVKQLKSVHPLHAMLRSEWAFLYAAYEGTRELIRQGYLKRHERETPENYQRRCDTAYGFNYTESVVDIYNFYLFKKPVKRELPESVENDELYKMYVKDCDLYGNDVDEFLTEQSRIASIMGFTGVMVDKANVSVDSRAEQIDNEVYPYLSSYYPTAILDWCFEKDEYGRPTLTMLKLLEDNGQYLIWYPTTFEVWAIPEVDEGKHLTDDMEAVLINNEDHTLGEIPFIWVLNKKWRIKPIGKSDVSDISRIDVSIIRNLSQGEEIIDYSAFPMMRKPQREARPDQSSDQTDDSGPAAILEFDPDNPDAKPDWLSSDAADPLNAIKDWIRSKVEEIYRSANIGGMAATEVSTVAKSGAALVSEFQLLNSNLVRKAINLEKAEKRIMHFWYLWEYSDQAKTLMDDTKIERHRTYDVEDLATDLENALTSKTIVGSKTFDAAVQKKTARQMFPSWTDSQFDEIDKEIEVTINEPPPEFEPFGPNGEEPPGAESGTTSTGQQTPPGQQSPNQQTAPPNTEE